MVNGVNHGGSIEHPPAASKATQQAARMAYLAAEVAQDTAAKATVRECPGAPPRKRTAPRGARTSLTFMFDDI
jgi:hypothetical protein